MPSHTTHYLFFRQCLEQLKLANDEFEMQNYTKAHVLGTIGPDLFYHNLRTRPSALLYAGKLHRRGFGQIAADMLSRAETKDERDFTYSFISHAILDRLMHPYINYFAGFTVRKSQPYRDIDKRSHMFLERCIDSALIKKRLHMKVQDFDFYTLLPDKQTALQLYTKLMLPALHTVYNQPQQDDELRIHNAVNDAYGFYSWINKASTQDIALYADSPKRISLFTPTELDSGFTPLHLGSYPDPIDTDSYITDSVEGILHKACVTYIKVHKSIQDFHSDKISKTDLADKIGNGNLRDGKKGVSRLEKEDQSKVRSFFLNWINTLEASL